MFLITKPRILLKLMLITLVSTSGISACNTVTAPASSSSTAATSSARFATGTKGVKIITSVTNLTGSFTAPSAVPTPTIIPSPYPGADGASTYNPGIAPTTYFDLDGSTQIMKPSWLIDFQMGITGTSSSGKCAAFGGGINPLDPQDFFRVSEYDCARTIATGCGVAAPGCDGTGYGLDPVFFRIVLNRDNTLIGSAENLMVQVEYQASGLHLNSDGSAANAEDNLDQLWKIYWNSSLAPLATPKSFGVFVPPNYAACMANGSGGASGSGSCPHGTPNTYRGSPTKVRQFIIPLSAYPTMSVIQFSRAAGRRGGASDYVPAFCTGDDPLCLGVVIRSVTIMRM